MTSSVFETPPPQLSVEEAQTAASDFYGISASAELLVSERDQNFLLCDRSGERYVLKIANPSEVRATLEMQNGAITHILEKESDLTIPRVRKNLAGEGICLLERNGDATFMVRLLDYIPGRFLKEVQPHTPELLRQLGRLLARMDRALEGYTHSGAERSIPWNVTSTAFVRDHLFDIEDAAERAIVDCFASQFERSVIPRLPSLRRSIIHNDGNDDNILIRENSRGESEIAGVIDFGDMVFSAIICELAVSIAYVMLGKKNPLQEAGHVVTGYHRILPLEASELEVLFPLACMRLCTTVAMAAYRKKLFPQNEYIRITKTSAGTLLRRLIKVDLQLAQEVFEGICRGGTESAVPTPEEVFPSNDRSTEDLLQARSRHLGKSLSTAYERPLKIVKGRDQYLLDESGRPYLDAVNNVCHVGHCHPKVVEALHKQSALLNTNTRYLHDTIIDYAQRLSEKLPDPLNVCFFVNSGSEANELAIRLAKAHTGATDFIVIDGAYHGNTHSVMEISPYKFDAPGGSGAPPHVHKVPTPDGYRGQYKQDDPDAGKMYAHAVKEVITTMTENGRRLAAFFGESLMSCGGQIIYPRNYLKEAYRHTRDAGGVCVADEVQVGFGRVGTHFWGFDTQDVVPDIVTLGKPMGNGHPVSAVVTTPEISESFAKGLEYFNTFGGNPVSCAIAAAVLDVIEEEKLQENALRTGTALKEKLQLLKTNHKIIGDVRGLGLFLGIELVLDRQTLAPATQQAAVIINRIKEEGILLSTDGPLHNVLKIKPPIIFSEPNVDFLIVALDKILSAICD